MDNEEEERSKEMERKMARKKAVKKRKGIKMGKNPVVRRRKVVRKTRMGMERKTEKIKTEMLVCWTLREDAVTLEDYFADRPTSQLRRGDPKTIAI